MWTFSQRLGFFVAWTPELSGVRTVSFCCGMYSEDVLRKGSQYFRSRYIFNAPRGAHLSKKMFPVCNCRIYTLIKCWDLDVLISSLTIRLLTKCSSLLRKNSFFKQFSGDSNHILFKNIYAYRCPSFKSSHSRWKCDTAITHGGYNIVFLIFLAHSPEGNFEKTKIAWFEE